jgi:hypothetical protein
MSALILAADIGATALFLLYGWLASAIVSSFLSARAGFGERLGLGTGLLLTVLGVVIWLGIYLADPRGARKGQVHSPTA